MTGDWEVHSTEFPNTILFYLRLTQDAAGRVTGIVFNKATDAVEGQTDPAGQARIDATGNLTTLRIKMKSGADITMSGRMLSDGTSTQVDGTFSNTSMKKNGRPLNGLPFTLSVD